MPGHKTLDHFLGHIGSAALALFGSLKNIAQFLLDSFRFFQLGADAFNPTKTFQIRLCDSS